MLEFALVLFLLISLAAIALRHGADSRQYDRSNWW